MGSDGKIFTWAPGRSHRDAGSSLCPNTDRKGFSPGHLHPSSWEGSGCLVNTQPHSSLLFFEKSHRGGHDAGIWGGVERRLRREGIRSDCIEGLCSTLGSPEHPAAYSKIGSDFRVWPSLRRERTPSQRSKRAICCPARPSGGKASLCVG